MRWKFIDPKFGKYTIAVLNSVKKKIEINYPVVKNNYGVVANTTVVNNTKLSQNNNVPKKQSSCVKR